MANLQQLLQQLQGGGGMGVGAAAGGMDIPVADTAETIQISSMALIKMIKVSSCVEVGNNHPFNF